MSGLESKKMAFIRILQILQKYSDCDHPLTQSKIAYYLENDYGIILERKAISNNIRSLMEAGYEIVSGHTGAYLEAREFEDEELRMLIDGVLSSKHISAKHSKDLIEKLSSLSSIYFKSHIKNVFSVNDWSKTDNHSLFYNIEVVDKALERKLQIKFDYNKYGTDKKLHKSFSNRVTPYQLILHNQRYYLMCYNEYFKNITYYRVDHITNIRIDEKPATLLTDIPGYERGINYKEIASAMPYMYADKPQTVDFIASRSIVDQIIDWFGKDVKFTDLDENRVTVSLKSSINAMEYWAMQYLNHVEIVKPAALREKIKENLQNAVAKYN